jgi:hypothetical protein
MTADFLLSVLIAFSTGAGVYAAIRADMARLHEKTKAAHQRIDLIEKIVFKS